ncbi:MAG: hypothetical protein UW42_C0010G0004 [Candidatus Collierbacteria bacterium GW2011_GWB1_44_197]|nr:MAG: hypothetical protein UW42_C0010G0004 [Candidatus Collierbacteria bacterium GW2011_GWB1_44_197]
MILVIEIDNLFLFGQSDNGNVFGYDRCHNRKLWNTAVKNN